MFAKTLRLVFLITLLIFPALAQTPFAPASTHSKRTYDVQHYIIRSALNYAEKKLTGQTTVQLKSLADGFISFELDAAGMEIESVKLDGGTGKELNFKLFGDKLIVTLDRKYSPAELVSVTVKYTVTDPKKGV